jgi:hypothetical protein
MAFSRLIQTSRKGNSGYFLRRLGGVFGWAM